MNKDLDIHENAYYGSYGGQFVPETLMVALEELQSAFRSAQSDPSFAQDLESLLSMDIEKLFQKY